MTMRRTTRAALVATAIGLLGVASALPLRAPAVANGATAELLFFPSGTLLKPACLGFDTLVADLCWMRTLQYYGLHRLTDHRYEGSQHLFTTVTELDPQYQSAYLLGAVVLAQDVGDTPAAMQLLARGMRARPADWQLPFEAGFVWYVVEGNPERAEPWFRRAAALAPQPDLARRFAAWCAMRAGRQEDATAMWAMLAEQTEDPTLRRVAQQYLARLGTRAVR